METEERKDCHTCEHAEHDIDFVVWCEEYRRLQIPCEGCRKWRHKDDKQ